MRKISFFLFLLFLWQSVPLSSQNILSEQLNGERIGDCLFKERIPYSNPGSEGIDAVWDFSRINKSGMESHIVRFEEDSIFYYKKEDRTLFQLYSHNDSVILLSYENPLTYVKYDNPQLYMAFPLSFNKEEYHSSFHGKGAYCNLFKVEEQGNIDIYADGEGTLILSPEDTLNNVIRVKKVKTSSVKVFKNTPEEDRKLMIEETYLWYARGYRYPLYEIKSSTFLYDLQPVERYQTAYSYVPKAQRKIRDVDNEQIAKADSMMTQNSHGGIRYEVTVENKHAKVSVDLSDFTRIQIVVADIYGYMHVQQSFSLESGQHCLDIDCSSQREDWYVLYLNANGIIYNEKIYLR